MEGIVKKDLGKVLDGWVSIVYHTQMMCIPQIFNLYNEGFLYEDHRRSRFFYSEIPKSYQAGGCTECHECEEKCLQE